MQSEMGATGKTCGKCQIKKLNCPFSQTKKNKHPLTKKNQTVEEKTNPRNERIQTTFGRDI